MKIYYVANARMPNEKAHGIQLAQQCEAFIAQGIDLELVLPKQKNATKDSIESFYSLEKKIPVRLLPVLNFGHTGLAFNVRSLSFGISSFVYLLFKVRGKNVVTYTAI
jgi:hypothetical protein